MLREKRTRHNNELDCRAVFRGVKRKKNAKQAHEIKEVLTLTSASGWIRVHLYLRSPAFRLLCYHRGRMRFQLGSTCLRISASSSRLR